jgi:hypothetical protein
MSHHDVLRARLEIPAGGPWRLRIPAAGSAGGGEPVRRVDASGLDGPALQEMITGCARDAAARLDPVAGVMVQAVWCDTGPSRPGRLVIAVHHLVVDAVSWQIILPGLAAACAAGAGRDLVPGLGAAAGRPGRAGRAGRRARGLAAAAAPGRRVAGHPAAGCRAGYLRQHAPGVGDGPRTGHRGAADRCPGRVSYRGR